MRILKKHSVLCFLTALILFNWGSAQEDQIQWLNFEQLEDSLSVKPKKSLLTFMRIGAFTAKKWTRPPLRMKK